jgi:hypothetical protein
MNSDELTQRQLVTLKKQGREMLRFLARLQGRMIKRMFLESDYLLKRVRATHSAVHALRARRQLRSSALNYADETSECRLHPY